MRGGTERAHPEYAFSPALWTAPICGAAAAGLAFCVYLASLAPGLTWAHEAADGGELLAAAVSNGVPHPPGYPLYILLLQGWLAILGAAAPASDVAWRGNLLSALLGAVSVFVAVLAAWGVLPESPRRPLWAGLAGVLWGLSPLLWSQSILTEVYALHALIVVLLGWITLRRAERQPWLLALPVALGVAHHLTLLLLVPAVLYWVWHAGGRALLARATGWIVLGLLLGALMYARIPLVARHAPPVNWGYADTWQGLWWLVSGAAYRSYLFAAPPASIARQVGNWAYTVAAQYTLVGLGLALWGLAIWDERQPALRTFSLLWLVPVSIYTVSYYTRDSLIYLLPVGWLMALWLAAGCDDLSARLAQRTRHAASISAACAVVLAGGVLIWQWPAVALRGDDEARAFVRGAAAVLEAESILVSRSDAETFALWYGTWGSGEIERSAPGVIPVNDWLYQFDWYGRLQTDLYPGVEGAGESAQRLVEGNAGLRPIYFAEELPIVRRDTLVAAPPLWRYTESGP